jgi:hypothetical protein
MRAANITGIPRLAANSLDPSFHDCYTYDGRKAVRCLRGLSLPHIPERIGFFASS